MKMTKTFIIAVVALFGSYAGLSAQSLPTTGNLNNKGPLPTDEVTNAIFIPSCFTPNGDGKNDEFMVYSELVKDISLRIYDKTGEEVFATIEMNEGWDGKHYNRELKQDVYLYRVQVTYLNGEDEVLVGSLNLMR